MGTRWTHREPAPEPSGPVESRSVSRPPDRQKPICKCGAGLSPDHEDRCANGHVLPGNLAGAIVGHRSARFWQEHAEVQQELGAAVIRDAGFDPDDVPPKALELAASGIAQAVLVRDSAYARMVESGGPLTSSGRTRRAFEVWLKASDRLERHLRMVGLKKAPRPVQSLEEVMADD